MASTSSERKAEETKRKAELGLKRRSFWLSEQSIQTIEKYKTDNQLQTNDEAINQILAKQNPHYAGIVKSLLSHG